MKQGLSLECGALQKSRTNGVVRNKTVYEKVGNELKTLGYDRTWEQWRNKIKNLVKRYKKVS